jgi:hypothetical protein
MSKVEKVARAIRETEDAFSMEDSHRGCSGAGEGAIE